MTSGNRLVDIRSQSSLFARVAFDVIWERALDSDVVSWGDSVETVFGYPRSEVVNHLSWWRAHVHPDDRDVAEQRAFSAVQAADTGWSNEYRFRRRDGSWAWIASRGAIERDHRGVAVRVVGAMLDVTALKETETRLRVFTEQIKTSEKRLRSVLEALPVGVVVLDSAGNVLLDNPASKRIWGEPVVSAPERWARSKGFWRGSGTPIGAEEWPWQHALTTGDATGGECIDVEMVDGARRTIQHAAVPMRDEEGRLCGAIVVNEDITERTRVASELERNREQLQALSRKLIEAQEAERRAVARELHDDLGQILTAIKLNLQRRERDQAESIALVDTAIARMRDLAQDLRPPLLDEFGLEASLRWYLERETTRAGLSFELSYTLPLIRRPAAAVETTCFRVAQESVTNAIRHARARHVAVAVADVEGALVLTVRDDGLGFDVPAARRRANCQGLLGIQERVALIGGALRIDSNVKGTTVCVTIPLRTVV